MKYAKIETFLAHRYLWQENHQIQFSVIYEANYFIHIISYRSEIYKTIYLQNHLRIPLQNQFCLKKGRGDHKAKGAHYDIFTMAPVSVC